MFTTANVSCASSNNKMKCLLPTSPSLPSHGSVANTFGSWPPRIGSVELRPTPTSLFTQTTHTTHVQRRNKLEEHSMHNSRPPFDRLTIYDYRRECKRTATLEQHGCSNILAATFLHFVTL